MNVVLEARRQRTLPVVEIFGPTVQGEGPDSGKPCQFIRFGLCDYFCSWCDSMYAVEPGEVRKHAERLTTEQIVERVGPTRIVVFSGGNPAIHDLSSLTNHLQMRGHFISVETQGSKWKAWLAHVNRLVVSPKPPSSLMATPEHEAETEEFMRKAISLRPWDRRPDVKIVVFDETDYQWAIAFHQRYPGLPFYLSAGTPQLEVMQPVTTVRNQIGKRYAWLAERAVNDERAQQAVIQLQLHAVAWGNERAR